MHYASSPVGRWGNTHREKMNTSTVALSTLDEMNRYVVSLAFLLILTERTDRTESLVE